MDYDKMFKQVMAVIIGACMVIGAICAWYHWHIDALIAVVLGLVGIGFISYPFRE